MGVFSNNRTLGNIEVEPDFSYHGILGSLQMMAETYENDRNVFNSVICNDIAEAMSIQEGSEIILDEASISDALKKIKQFIRKCWEKIIGLLKGFKAKLDSVIMKDNKAFFKKYNKIVMKKDLSKMKCKYEKPKSNGKYELKNFSSDISTKLEKIANIKNSKIVDQAQTDREDNEYINKLLTDALGESTDISSFKNDCHEHYFETKDSYDELSNEMLTHIKNILTNNNAVKSIEKLRNEYDKIFKELLSSIDNNKEKLYDMDKSGTLKINDKTDKHGTKLSYGGKKSKDLINKKLTYMYDAVSDTQKANSILATGIIQAIKFDISQCRRLYAQAVAFNPKSTINDAYIEIVGESAEYEIESSFDSYEENYEI